MGVGAGDAGHLDGHGAFGDVQRHHHRLGAPVLRLLPRRRHHLRPHAEVPADLVYEGVVVPGQTRLGLRQPVGGVEPRRPAPTHTCKGDTHLLDTYTPAEHLSQRNT